RRQRAGAWTMRTVASSPASRASKRPVPRSAVRTNRPATTSPTSRVTLAILLKTDDALYRMVQLPGEAGKEPTFVAFPRAGVMPLSAVSAGGDAGHDGAFRRQRRGPWRRGGGMTSDFQSMGAAFYAPLHFGSQGEEAASEVVEGADGDYGGGEPDRCGDDRSREGGAGGQHQGEQEDARDLSVGAVLGVDAAAAAVQHQVAGAEEHVAADDEQPEPDREGMEGRLREPGEVGHEAELGELVGARIEGGAEAGGEAVAPRDEAVDQVGGAEREEEENEQPEELGHVGAHLGDRDPHRHQGNSPRRDRVGEPARRAHDLVVAPRHRRARRRAEARTAA